MRNKKKEKKAKEASDKAIMASVAEEMAQPRVAKSASIKIDKRINATDGKLV
jgi:hypothetical protein